MSVFRPWAFQGSISRRNYFEGWYFKHVSADKRQVWSFIPGISLSSEGRHAFIQVLNGLTAESHVYEFVKVAQNFEINMAVEINRAVHVPVEHPKQNYIHNSK